MSRLFLILVALAVAVASAMSFEPPGPEQRLAAIGATNGLPVVLRGPSLRITASNLCRFQVRSFTATGNERADGLYR